MLLSQYFTYSPVDTHYSIQCQQVIQSTLRAVTTLGATWRIKFLYRQLDAKNSCQIVKQQKIDTWRNDNNNLLCELYQNDKVLSADIPEGQDEEMLSTFIHMDICWKFNIVLYSFSLEITCVADLGRMYFNAISNAALLFTFFGWWKYQE